MKKIHLTLALTLLTSLFLAPAVLAQPDCPRGQGVTYISHDPEECLTLQFICVEGQVRFDSECGCGCMETSSVASNGSEEAPALDELPSPLETVLPARACQGPEIAVDRVE